MKTFDEIAKSFAEKWAIENKKRRNSKQLLENIESEAVIKLPENFKTFINEYGEVYTPHLLDSICEGDHVLSDIQNFLELEDIIETTKSYESAGMDTGFLAFASDCMGNLFMFRKSECVEESEDAKVYFFDHDYVTIEQEEKSFSKLLQRYLKIKKTKG